MSSLDPNNSFSGSKSTSSSTGRVSSRAVESLQQLSKQASETLRALQEGQFGRGGLAASTLSQTGGVSPTSVTTVGQGNIDSTLHGPVTSMQLTTLPASASSIDNPASRAPSLNANETLELEIEIRGGSSVSHEPAQQPSAVAAASSLDTDVTRRFSASTAANGTQGLLMRQQDLETTLDEMRPDSSSGREGISTPMAGYSDATVPTSSEPERTSMTSASRRSSYGLPASQISASRRTSLAGAGSTIESKMTATSEEETYSDDFTYEEDVEFSSSTVNAKPSVGSSQPLASSTQAESSTSAAGGAYGSTTIDGPPSSTSAPRSIPSTDMPGLMPGALRGFDSSSDSGSSTRLPKQSSSSSSPVSSSEASSSEGESLNIPPAVKDLLARAHARIEALHQEAAELRALHRTNPSTATDMQATLDPLVAIFESTNAVPTPAQWSLVKQSLRQLSAQAKAAVSLQYAVDVAARRATEQADITAALRAELDAARAAQAKVESSHRCEIDALQSKCCELERKLAERAQQASRGAATADAEARALAMKVRTLEEECAKLREELAQRPDANDVQSARKLLAELTERAAEQQLIAAKQGAKLEEELNRLRTRVKELERDNSALRSELDSRMPSQELEDIIATLRNQLQAQKSARAEESAALRSECGQLRARVQGLEGECAALRVQLGARPSPSELQAAQAAAAELREQLTAVRTALAQRAEVAEAAAAELRLAMTENERELRDLRQRVAAGDRAAAEMAHLERELAECRANARKIEEAATTAAQQARTRMEELEADNARLRAESEGRKHERVVIAQLREQLKQHASLEGELSTAQSRIRILETRLAEAEAQLASRPGLEDVRITQEALASVKRELADFKARAESERMILENEVERYRNAAREAQLREESLRAELSERPSVEMWKARGQELERVREQLDKVRIATALAVTGHNGRDAKCASCAQASSQSGNDGISSVQAMTTYSQVASARAAHEAHLEQELADARRELALCLSPEQAAALKDKVNQLSNQCMTARARLIAAASEIARLRRAIRLSGCFKASQIAGDLSSDKYPVCYCDQVQISSESHSDSSGSDDSVCLCGAQESCNAQSTDCSDCECDGRSSVSSCCGCPNKLVSDLCCGEEKPLSAKEAAELRTRLELLKQALAEHPSQAELDEAKRKAAALAVALKEAQSKPCEHVAPTTCPVCIREAAQIQAEMRAASGITEASGSHKSNPTPQVDPSQLALCPWHELKAELSATKGRLRTHMRNVGGETSHGTNATISQLHTQVDELEAQLRKLTRKYEEATHEVSKYKKALEGKPSQTEWNEAKSLIIALKAALEEATQKLSRETSLRTAAQQREKDTKSKLESEIETLQMKARLREEERIQEQTRLMNELKMSQTSLNELKSSLDDALARERTLLSKQRSLPTHQDVRELEEQVTKLQQRIEFETKTSREQQESLRAALASANTTIDHLKAELASCPTMEDLQKAQSIIERLRAQNNSLKSLVGVVLPASENGADGEPPSAAAATAALSHPELARIVIDLCTAFSIRDPNVLVPAVTKLAELVPVLRKKISEMEESKAVNAVKAEELKAKEAELEALKADLDKTKAELAETRQRLQEESKKVDEGVQTSTAHSPPVTPERLALLETVFARVRGELDDRFGRAAVDGWSPRRLLEAVHAMLSGPVLARPPLDADEFKPGHSRETPDQIVAYVMHLFEVKRYDGVIPKLNELYLYVCASQTSLTELRSVLNLRPKASLALIVRAVKRLVKEVREGSGDAENYDLMGHDADDGHSDDHLEYAGSPRDADDQNASRGELQMAAERFLAQRQSPNKASPSRVSKRTAESSDMRSTVDELTALNQVLQNSLQRFIRLAEAQSVEEAIHILENIVAGTRKSDMIMESVHNMCKELFAVLEVTDLPSAVAKARELVNQLGTRQLTTEDTARSTSAEVATEHSNDASTSDTQQRPTSSVVGILGDNRPLVETPSSVEASASAGENAVSQPTQDRTSTTNVGDESQANVSDIDASAEGGPEYSFTLPPNQGSNRWYLPHQ